MFTIDLNTILSRSLSLSLSLYLYVYTVYIQIIGQSPWHVCVVKFLNISSALT